jgi:predicted nucleotidyltransferase component of viral defense system
MKGLTPQTGKIFEKISKLECIKEYILIGGTALSLQIDKRLSEDLDFCIWTSTPGKDKPVVNRLLIEQELSEKIGKITKVDILGFNQVNFEVEGVKISFYANQINRSPVGKIIQILNNIKVPDIETIGAMKLEVMQRRSRFRDYYDLYSILQENISLNSLLDKAVNYSGNKIKSKNICAFITNGDNFKKDKEFELLNPKFNINPDDIAKFIINKLKEENPIELSKAIYNNDRAKVNEILNRAPGIVSKRHLELINEMKASSKPLDQRIEVHIKQKLKENEH